MFLDSQKSVADLSFPLGDYADVHLVVNNSFSRVTLDGLELLELLLVLLVDVVQVLLGHDALKALVLLLSPREERCWRVVDFAVDAKS